MERKWNPTLGELLDRMSIVSLKITHNKDLREEYAKEMQDLVDDVNVILTNIVHKEKVNAEFLKFVIILSQYNTMIWQNESAARGDGTGSELYKTHIFNGIRCRAKDFISTYSKERIDPKIDALGADISEWEPVWK